jgi:hypothetical protein
MSVEVDYFYYDNAWQDEEFGDWTWPLPRADGRYWSCAIIPEYANVSVCEITRFFWSTDNSQNFTANFTIRVDYQSHAGGVNFGFKAIRAPSA